MLVGRSGSARRVTLAALASLMGVLVAAVPAVAKDSATEAEPLIRQGLELRRQNHDERALPFFQKAYELVRTPRTEGQLGLVEMALGYWLDADQHLTEVLAASDHPWVAKNRKTLQDALARVRHNIGDIMVEGAPAGAAVLVNGQPAGTTPLTAPIRAAKGRVEIEVRAPGFKPATVVVDVEGEDHKRAAVTLAKDEPPPAPEPVRTLPSAPAEPVVGGAEPREPAAAQPAGGARRKVAWVTGIAAGLAVAAAAAETVRWQINRRDFENHHGPPPDNPTLPQSQWLRDCGGTEPGRGSVACQSLYDAAHDAEMFAIIGYAVGGALAVTSGVLFVTGRANHPDDEARIACVPDLVGRGFGCRLTF